MTHHLFSYRYIYFYLVFLSLSLSLFFSEVPGIPLLSHHFPGMVYWHTLIYLHTGGPLSVCLWMRVIRKGQSGGCFESAGLSVVETLLFNSQVVRKCVCECAWAHANKRKWCNSVSAPCLRTWSSKLYKNTVAQDGVCLVLKSSFLGRCFGKEWHKHLCAHTHTHTHVQCCTAWRGALPFSFGRGAEVWVAEFHESKAYPPFLSSLLLPSSLPPSLLPQALPLSLVSTLVVRW